MRTKRVKITALVDQAGNWAAYGSSEYSLTDAFELAKDYIDGPYYRRVVITVEIPVPSDQPVQVAAEQVKVIDPDETVH